MHTQTAELLNIDTRRKNKESVSSCELGVSAQKKPKKHTHTTPIRFTLHTPLKADELQQVCVCVCVRGWGAAFWHSESRLER